MDITPRSFASRRLRAFAVLTSLACGAVALAQPATQPTTAPTTGPTTRPKPIVLKLELQPDALSMDVLKRNGAPYAPTPVRLVIDKPAGITKEPSYVGTPKYGAIRVGNGPKAVTLLAVDDGPDNSGKLYVDRNQNGDLTDDGDGAWDEAKVFNGITEFHRTFTVHASYGTPLQETEAGDYGLFLYKRHGDDRMSYARAGARTGTLELEGKPYPVVLSEGNGDGQYIVAVKYDRSRGPVQLMVDLDGDGTFRGTKQTTADGKTIYLPEVFALNEPFQLGSQWWCGSPTISGSELTLVPVNAPNAGSTVTQAPQEEKQLLAAGTVAPDFTALLPDGKPVKLSDLKGKIVILDFWATWCGPCKASMPGLSKIYAKAKDQNVAELSVCVWDEKEPFDNFIASDPGKTYGFTYALDPAGSDAKTSIAGAKYGVSGIPTMYVIDKDGKIAGSLVGSGNEEKLTALLSGMGVKLAAD